MNIARLLIDEPPLVVVPSLAAKIGLNEAIIIQQLHYWLNGASGEIINGERWIYNTDEDWLGQFPWLSKSTFRRAVNNLKNAGLIEVCQHRKTHHDRTNYYTINYANLDATATAVEEAVEEAPGAPKSPVNNGVGEHIDVVNLNSSDVVNLTTSDVVNLTTSHTETTTETTTERVKHSREAVNTTQFKPHPADWAEWGWPEPPDPQIFADWIRMRKTKKFTISLTSFRRIGRGLTDALALGYTVDTCLALAESKSWQGLEAEWVANAQPKPKPPAGTTGTTDWLKPADPNDPATRERIQAALKRKQSYQPPKFLRVINGEQEQNCGQ